MTDPRPALRPWDVIAADQPGAKNQALGSLWDADASETLRTCSGYPMSKPWLNTDRAFPASAYCVVLRGLLWDNDIARRACELVSLGPSLESNGDQKRGSFADFLRLFRRVRITAWRDPTAEKPHGVEPDSSDLRWLMLASWEWLRRCRCRAVDPVGPTGDSWRPAAT